MLASSEFESIKEDSLGPSPAEDDHDYGSKLAPNRKQIAADLKQNAEFNSKIWFLVYIEP